ncbi:MAG: nucleotidyltransferase domain-containing protein [Candidatus Hodarchaeota archaeon]
MVVRLSSTNPNSRLIDLSTIQSLVSEIYPKGKTTVYLVGSYANNTASVQSDLDFLIISKKILIKRTINHLSNKINEKFSHLIPKIDIKVISWEEFHLKHSKNYLYLYSMITTGKLLLGDPVRIKLIPELLNQELNRIINQQEEVEEYIIRKFNFEYSGALLFDIGKSLHHLERTISPNRYSSLKEIWGGDLVFLGTLYEKVVSKGISSSLSLHLMIQKQRRGNFKRIIQANTRLRDYKNVVKNTFREWYETQL